MSDDATPNSPDKNGPELPPERKTGPLEQPIAQEVHLIPEEPAMAAAPIAPPASESPADGARTEASTAEPVPPIEQLDPASRAVAKLEAPRRNFTLRLGELIIFLTAIIGAVALGLGISSYFAAHPYVSAYLVAYAAFRFADLLVREDATLWTDREGFARRVAYQLPILLLFATAPFERTYIYGAEAPPWAAGLGLLIELAGLWLALGARIQLGFFSGPLEGGERKLVHGGLYRYIRHPIFLGEFLVLVAWPFEYGAPVTEVVMLIVGLTVLYRRIRREEAEMLAYHGDDYASYMRETDRIVPNVW
ncbi:MAG: isoprenylcysteine carboxylmethyltransferase family protein [Candidatus Binataceae bacterium]|jgi:protein-S-isoprenylcysteine O-methyltransferase Ste14